MDTEKPRLSLSIVGDQPSSSLSVLRLSTRSPSFSRLGLRRSRASSVSTASSSSESPPHAPLSCVTREVPRDDCALNRFVVWAAVKRNASQRLSSADRLECPLLRCRKRFSNHELMLRHLYSCEELESGEYWCYECGKVEIFTDAKCKKCLGHPTKRRKMLSMAKTFFTSIGHKAKKDVMHNPLPDDDLVPPPSYDSLAIELCTTSQIHEIDSVEIPSVEPPRRAQPSRVRTYLQSPKPTLQPEPSPFFDTALPESVPSCVIPAELDNSLMNPACHDSTVMTWINDPAAYIPFEFPAGDRRSIISIGSHMGDDRRAKTRSKTLAPSSSLRSNASSSSTNSTNSTSSTSTTDSVDTVNTEVSISPSEWNDIWPIASGMEVDLDSPMSNLLCQPAYEIDSLHPTPPFGTPLDGDLILPDVISELPADTPPFSSIPNVPDDLLESAALFTLETCDDEPALCHTLADLSKPLAPEVNVLPYSTGAASSLAAHEPSRTDPSSLITAAWETLLAHISSSKTKLQHLRTNPLALLFLSTEPQDIAASGHAALARILDGNAPSSPFELLCFVHVAYSYFLVLHEDDAPAFSHDLFTQAASYTRCFTVASPKEYLEVTRAIWQPDNFESYASTSLGLFCPSSLANNCQSGEPGLRNGKEPMRGTDNGTYTPDLLVGVVQRLLDELEHSLLSRAGSETLQGLASELWTTHLKEASLLSRVNDPTFSISVGLTVNAVRQKFVHVPGLSATLLSVNNLLLEGQIATVRRAELELLQAASHSLPPATFLKEYSPFVRRHFDALYADTSLGSAPRAIYYLHAIRLVESAFTSASPQASHDLGYMLDSLDTQFIFDKEDAALLSGVSSDIESPLQGSTVASTKGTSQSSMSSPSEPLLDCVVQNGGISSESSCESQKIEADACCDICGYRPKGDPQWFKGSMAKHKKLQHSQEPPRIYKCPYPGCTSQYKNRPDNLRQHQLDKNHFVEGEEGNKRPTKRKKMD